MDFFKVLKLLGFPVIEASQRFTEMKAQINHPEWMEAQKWQIFDYHYNNNKSYRDFVGEYPKSWQQVPVLNKRTFRDNGITLLPDQKAEPKYYNKRTSGSTGNPFSFNIDYLTHTLTWMLLSDRYQSTGVTLNDLQARFYGSPFSLTSKWIEKAKDWLTNRIRFNTYDVSDANLENWVKLFTKKRFKYIYGYSHPIRMLAKYLAERDIRLTSVCPTLTSCIVTSEMCSLEEQHLIEQMFGVPVFNEYGSSEVGVIGFGRNGKWRLSDELVYTEILDDHGNTCKSGEVGNVTVTSLFCKGTPLIKYNIGDLASIETINKETCLTNLQGRIEESAILSSGKKVAGDSVFFYVFKEFTNHCTVVNEYKVVQLSPSGFQINISASRDLNRKEEEELRSIAISFLEPGVDIQIIRKDVLERTGMGKFKQFERRF